MAPLSFELKQNQVPATDVPSVREWYAKKRIFITGATGFLGKVLVERLLQLFPDIECIYMLVRKKKGVSSATRFNEYSNDICFERVRKTNIEAFKKLRLIEGDILQEQIISHQNDRTELIKNVNIVIHCAATVKFNHTLKEALNFNVLGSYKVLELAKQMEHLTSFCHVSTAFSQQINQLLEEKIYPTNFEPMDMINLLHILDEDSMELLKPKFLGNRYCNTYTYSKAMAEKLMHHYSSSLPIAIARPAIVLCSQKWPMPGYTEPLYGPNGLAHGGAHGLLRSMYARGDRKVTYVPVDMVAHALISISWARSLKMDSCIPVYNLVDSENSMNWDQALEIGYDELINKCPYSKMMWYPFGHNSYTWWAYRSWAFLLHDIPGFIIDLLLLLTFQKPRMTRLYSRIDAGIREYSHFTVGEWTFKTDNLKSLYKELPSQDREVLTFDVWALDWEAYIRTFTQGLRVYLAKDPPETIPKAKKLLKKLYILHVLVKYTIPLILLWLIFHIYGIYSYFK